MSRIRIITDENLEAAQQSDVLILSSKPYMVNTILSEKGMREALAGKVLISICAGVSAEDLEKAVYGDVSTADPLKSGRCRMVRVMPNTGATIRQSMTVISAPTPPYPDVVLELVTFIFSTIGRVTQLPPSLMDAATSLCGSGPAFFLCMLEAAIDGGLAMGIPRPQATLMAAQTMLGAAMGVLGSEEGAETQFEGKHPALLREQVTTPGGCTIGGLAVMHEEGVPAGINKAIRRATVVASQLGQGVKNVNGA
jgi:pyrroline-5-carboxylate reductase